jgi:hypothetical protein
MIAQAKDRSQLCREALECPPLLRPLREPARGLRHRQEHAKARGVVTDDREHVAHAVRLELTRQVRERDAGSACALPPGIERARARPIDAGEAPLMVGTPREERSPHIGRGLEPRHAPQLNRRSRSDPVRINKQAKPRVEQAAALGKQRVDPHRLLEVEVVKRGAQSLPRHIVGPTRSDPEVAPQRRRLPAARSTEACAKRRHHRFAPARAAESPGENGPRVRLAGTSSGRQGHGTLCAARPPLCWHARC